MTSTISHIGKCLGCYDALDQGSIYHPKCSKALFGTLIPPVLDTTIHEIETFAHKFISKRLAVTGVQRKLSLQIEPNGHQRLTVIGGLGGGYIMKPPSPEYEQMPEIEDLSMHLATICGIKTALHGLLPLKDGPLAYVTKRFDRIGKKKVAVEDLCQLSELLTEQKYRASHEQAGKIIRRYSSFPGDDALRFFELVLFSFIIGNNDMHLKNFSMFTGDPKHILLTPAYDILAVRLILSEKDDPEDMALTVNGKKKSIKAKDFYALSERLGIPEKVAKRVLKNQINAQEKMASIINKSFLSSNLRTKFLQLITSRVTGLAND